MALFDGLPLGFPTVSGGEKNCSKTRCERLHNMYEVLDNRRKSPREFTDSRTIWDYDMGPVLAPSVTGFPWVSRQAQEEKVQDST